MSKKIVKKITVVLYIVLVLLLGVATIIEAFRGTGFVEKNVYHAVYFIVLWGGLALSSLVIFVKHSLWKRLSVFLLHSSFLVILVGALVTYLWGIKGYVHLRTGVEVNTFCSTDDKQLFALPFTIRLDSFLIENYPGTQAPKDYVSYITGRTGENTLHHVRISMNKIWKQQGYRFYQTSFDEDRSGSVLTVNYDPWGTAITYMGYVLMALSMLGVLFSRKETFLHLLRTQIKKERRGAAPLVLLIAGFTLCASSSFAVSPTVNIGESLPALNIEQADSLSRLPVVYNDRLAPLNTLARDFLLKLCGEARYKGLTPEQVIGGWLLYPERWKHEPVIHIKDARLRHHLGLTTSYACLSDLFDGDTYRLQQWYGKGDQKMDKAIWEVDEKVGLISMLLQGSLIQPVTVTDDVASLPKARISAELLYNKVPFCKILFMVNLTLGLLGVGFLFYRLVNNQKESRVNRGFDKVMAVLLYAVTCFHLLGYILHGYIAQHIPLGNGYETMMFLALVLLVVACLFRRKYPFFVPFGFLLSGFALLVAYLGQKNPQLTPLMPVLLSPWLSSHVSLIMMSYALFAFIMLNGIFAVVLIIHSSKDVVSRRRYVQQIRQLTVLNRILLYPAVFFLSIGIFLGAVWANESWGRYWAWDPKEVWALITMMVYGAAFHIRSVKFFRKPLFYHLYLVLAFLTVLMTYFGVNYVLGGMHSYA